MIDQLHKLRLHLLTEHNFANAPSPRSEAIAHGESIYPLTLFIAWLERCPEAKRFLEQSEAPSLTTTGRQVPIASLLAGSPADAAVNDGAVNETFGVVVNGDLKQVAMCQVVGSVIVAQEVGSQRQHVIGLHHVIDADRDRVRRLVELHPGSKEKLEFDPWTKEQSAVETKREQP